MNQVSTLDSAKMPKTARGKRTRAKLLDAAEGEFGERGFHDASISGITDRAGVALGTFYVYFDSKEAVFRALVGHMGHLTRAWIAEKLAGVADRLAAERLGIEAFVHFARQHKALYRIVMEAQFVAPDAYRAYYENFAEAYRDNLAKAQTAGQISPGRDDVRAWSLIGLNVFLGLRYGVWDDKADTAAIAAAAGDFIAHGLSPRGGKKDGDGD
ncbi:MAG: TetR/AcrR family transcriptional regulator [Alphaproteobacteria bacterium]|nr:MAG: TetR/AcrR family transcriptional regulator [Alphaproteobacteria bacterium]